MPQALGPPDTSKKSCRMPNGSLTTPYGESRGSSLSWSLVVQVSQAWERGPAEGGLMWKMWSGVRGGGSR